MSVYKLFPEKDATIYSSTELKNTGLDEILELDLSLNSSPQGVSGSIITECSRYLIKFNQTQINDILNSKVSGSFKANLKFWLANASEIPLDYTLECYPISGSWNMGTGRYDNVPEKSDGVSWEFRNSSGSVPWATSSFSSLSTGSFISTSYESRPGGGNWYTGSSTLNPFSSQSFNYTSSKDINFDVTNIIHLYYSSSLPNDGFIIKNSNSNEFNSNVQFNLKYFSMDTHTVYPPCIEFKWNDYLFNTGSNTFNTVSENQPVLSLANNKIEFDQSSVHKFRIYARDRYPARTFQTSSIYLTNKYLPITSYYSIVDMNSEDVIYDFDTTYTKISADSTSSYFTLYMDSLEPERYYKILIKTSVNGSDIIFDNDYYFKVKS